MHVFRKKKNRKKVKTELTHFSWQPGKYKKLQYQKGNENDCKFICRNGVVYGGSTVIAFSSKFMEWQIEKEKDKQTGEDVGEQIELDFKLYETETIKVNIKMICKYCL